VLVVLLGLATNVLLTRLMTVAEVGAYFLIANLVVIGAVVAQLGMTQTVVRFTADALARELPGRARQVILSCLSITSLVALVLALVVYFGAGDWLARYAFKSELMASAVGMIAVWIFLQAVQRQLGETFRGLHDLRIASVFNGLVSGIVTVGFLWLAYLIYGRASLTEVLGVSVLAIAVSGLLAVLLLARRFNSIRGDGSVSKIELLTCGAPILLSAVTNLLLQRADIWVVGMFQPEEEVALYGAAARLITVVAVPLVMASAVLSPMIAELHAKGDKQRLEKVLRVVATLGGIPAIMVVLLFITAGEPILGFIYGDYYRSSATILFILSCGQMASMWAGVCAQLLMMTGHQKPVMYISLFSAILAIGASVVFVNAYKGVGVAVCFATGVMLQNVLMTIYAKRVLGVRSYMYLNPATVFIQLRQIRAARSASR
jgi:O-antigen/teichoic acid export membrane protein